MSVYHYRCYLLFIELNEMFYLHSVWENKQMPALDADIILTTERKGSILKLTWFNSKLKKLYKIISATDLAIRKVDH